MRASYQFLGAIGVLFTSALIFSAMRHPNGFGSTADWFGAAANLSVVITSLYLAGQETRERVRLERTATDRARGKLRGLILTTKSIGRAMRAWCTGNSWPDHRIRSEFALLVETLGIEWNELDRRALPIKDRAIANLLDPRIVSLRKALAVMTAWELPTPNALLSHYQLLGQLLEGMEDMRLKLERLPQEIGD